MATARVVDDPFTEHAPEPVTWDVARGRRVALPRPGGPPVPDVLHAADPTRPPATGCGLTPGPLVDRPDVTACGWTPDRRWTSPTTWAALDCPGGWSVDLAGRPMVLGTMTTRLDALPARRTRHVVMGRVLRAGGPQGMDRDRAVRLGAAPRLLARAAAVWIAVDPARRPIWIARRM